MKVRMKELTKDQKKFVEMSLEKERVFERFIKARRVLPCNLLIHSAEPHNCNTKAGGQLHVFMELLEGKQNEYLELLYDTLIRKK